MTNYNTKLQSNNTDLQEVLQLLQNKSAGGEQVVPEITIDSSTGLITATAGTKSATKQLAFQAAKTITPNTTNQVAVAAGRYVGGDITVKGDANLVAGNIKNGVNIFGVDGTYAGDGSGGGSSGGDTSVEDSLITRTLTTYTNARVTSIGHYAFYSCSSLTTVSFPVCTSIGKDAFCRCFKLTTVSFPVCTSIGDYAFYLCSGLTTVSFPVCTTIKNLAFAYCSSLSIIYLMASSVCTLSDSDAFVHTAITSTTGSIFVPASLVDAYKTATNWTYFANRIFAGD